MPRLTSAPTGHWDDLIHDTLAGVRDFAFDLLPTSWWRGRRGSDGDSHHIASPSNGSNRPTDTEAANEKACELLALVQKLRYLLVYGSDEYGGVNWDALSGGSNMPDSIRHIARRLRGLRTECAKKKSAMLFKVQAAAEPAEEVRRYTQLATEIADKSHSNPRSLLRSKRCFSRTDRSALTRPERWPRVLPAGEAGLRRQTRPLAA